MKTGLKSFRLILLLLLMSLFNNMLQGNQVNFSGDGGRGIRLVVLYPEGVGLNEEESHLPSLIQQILINNIKNNSAITVLDRQILETFLPDSDSSIYRDNVDFIMLKDLTNVNHVLISNMSRTVGGFMVTASVSSLVTGLTRVSHTQHYDLEELESLSGINELSLEILNGLGVMLTAIARNELLQPANILQRRAENTLAKGHSFLRQGSEFGALNYFLKAQTYDPTLYEATNRISVIKANLRGHETLDAAEFRRQWVQRLSDVERYFHEYFRRETLPYTLFYIDDIQLSRVDRDNDTVSYHLPGSYFHAHTIWLDPLERTLQAMYDALHTTGMVESWDLQRWPQRGVTSLHPFNRRNNNFNVVFELLNSDHRVIGSTTAELRSQLELNQSGRPSFVVNNNWGYSIDIDGILNSTQINFIEIRLSDITSPISVRVSTINGVNADIATRTGNLQIQPITQEEFQENARFILARHSGGGVGGFVNQASRTQTLDIPSTIWNDPVTFIGNMAFSNLGITSVFIPETVHIIGVEAFRNNRILSITGMENVVKIRERAFLNNSLHTLTIPDNVRTIGEEAFWGNRTERLTLGANLDLTLNQFGFTEHEELATPEGGIIQNIENLTLLNFYNEGGQRAGTYFLHPDLMRRSRRRTQDTEELATGGMSRRQIREERSKRSGSFGYHIGGSILSEHVCENTLFLCDKDHCSGHFDDFTYHTISMDILLPANTLRHWYYATFDADWGENFFGLYGGIGRKFGPTNFNVFTRGLFGFDYYSEKFDILDEEIEDEAAKTRRRDIARGIGFKLGVAINIAESLPVSLRLGYDYKFNHLTPFRQETGKAVHSNIFSVGLRLNFGSFDNRLLP